METGCPIAWHLVGNGIVMKDYLRLIRLPNLICIVLVQLAMYYLVISPVSNVAGVPVQKVFPESMLALLIIATVFTAAGGYVINDYYDVKIDEINHPIFRVVGKSVSKKTAMTLFIVLSIVGIVAGGAIGVYSYVELGTPFMLASTYVIVFLILVGILWFYSSSYKRIFVLGNFIASALNALIPMLVVIYYNFFLAMKFGSAPANVDFSRYLLTIVGLFSFFVFMWTFISEVADDFEEEKGDRELECHSFPIVWGHTVAKAILFGAIIFTNAACLHVAFRMLPFPPFNSIRYAICAVVVPSIGLCYLLAKASVRQDYHYVSLVSKVIMLLCIGYSILFYMSYGE